MQQRKKPVHQRQNEDIQNMKEYWTEHRITLIAFQTQYVYQKKYSVKKMSEQEDKDKEKNSKAKKKDLQYEGGFLFPGRGDEKENELNVTAEILKSQCNYLKELFNNDYKINEDLIELRQFIKIMLELKHISVFYEFMQIYDFIVRQMRDVKFQSLYQEQNRMNIIDRIAQKVGKLVEHKPPFKTLKGYLQEGRKQTNKLFKVTIYCFLAEKFNFNINEYYAEAFEIMEEQKKVPEKKRKME